MSLTAIIILILVGLLLVLVEFFVLPGTNIAGIIGLVLIVGALFFSYRDLGTPTAHYVLVAALILMGGSIGFALRSNTWNKLSLHTAIDSKMVTVEQSEVKPGDKGFTVTRLNPIGKIMVNDKIYEGKSGHVYIDQNTPVEVLKINGNQLIVKPLA